MESCRSEHDRDRLSLCFLQVHLSEKHQDAERFRDATSFLSPLCTTCAKVSVRPIFWPSTNARFVDSLWDLILSTYPSRLGVAERHATSARTDSRFKQTNPPVIDIAFLPDLVFALCLPASSTARGEYQGCERLPCPGVHYRPDCYLRLKHDDTHVRTPFFISVAGFSPGTCACRPRAFQELCSKPPALSTRDADLLPFADQPAPPAFRSLEEFKTHPAFLDGTLGLDMIQHPRKLSINLGEHERTHVKCSDEDCGGTVTIHHEPKKNAVVSHPLTEFDLDG